VNALVAESAVSGWPLSGVVADEPDLMGGIKLNDPSILDNQGDRAVPHPLEEPRQLADERLQIVVSGRVQTSQGAPLDDYATGISRKSTD